MSAAVSIMHLKSVNSVILGSFYEFSHGNGLSYDIPKKFALFSPVLSDFLHFLRKDIPEKVSRDHQEMLHKKNVDYHWKTDTLQEKERHIGFFQPLELLLTSIKWLLSESCFSPLGLKGLRNWGFSIRELMFLT